MLLFSLAFLVGCGRRPPAAVSRKGGLERPAISSTLGASRVVLADPKGRWSWEARVASGKVEEASGVGVFSNLETSYLLSGKPALRLRAERGRLDRRQETLLLEGNVRGESLLTGAKLAAREVSLDLRSSRFEARGGVRIETGAGLLSGESFSGDIGLKRVWGGEARGGKEG